MQITDNNCNKRTGADNNQMVQMEVRIPKTDNRIIRMWLIILLITASAFLPLILLILLFFFFFFFCVCVCVSNLTMA